jgi:hypothetical protein
MAHLVDAAGQLVLGVVEVGDVVASSGSAYAQTDVSSRAVVRHSGGGTG